jgi:predicted ATPase/DNA-binding winged helix-turn-helix (wHTH) protein
VTVVEPKEAVDWRAFDAFLLFPGQRLLKRDGKAIRIGDKALDLLIVLTESPGKIFCKADLANRVWHREWVEDVTIRVTIGALRKVLGRTPEGADYIVNTVGRGYSFSASVQVERWPRPTAKIDVSEVGADGPEPGRVPWLLKPVIGRRNDVERIVGLLDSNRLVTIVGPGGIGKTTTAISSVSTLAETQGGVCFVDFSPIQDPALVPARVAAALGFERSATDPTSYTLNYLSTKQRLLILDNCEHIAEAAAEIVEDILRGAPRVKVIATSREPLRAEGEVVHRLEGLTYPTEDGRINAKEALAFSAVQLFVERSQAANPDFALTDQLAPAVVEICRRLDGVALAIQLAASRVPALGVAGVAAQLAGSFHLLSNGQRTAMPRHRTLEAAFDWSFELLTPVERRLFTRLSIYRSSFTIDAAVEVAGWSGIDEGEIAAIVANLVEKSLVVLTGNERRPCYRLLEAARTFANARLEAAGETAEVAERHARRVIALCRDFRSLVSSTDDGSASSVARDGLDDLRSALRWAFGLPDGSLARELVFSSIPLLMHLGLTYEFKAWIARALEAETDPRGRLALSIGLGKAVHLLQSAPATQAQLYGDAFELAKELGDIEAALQALWGLTTTGQAAHRPRQIIEAARHFYDFAIVNDRVADSLVAQSLLAFGLHDLGAPVAAEHHLHHVLMHYQRAESVLDTQRYLFNYRALALSWLASVEWQTGRIERASKTAALAIAEAGDHVPSLFVILSHSAGPIAVERSDWRTATRYIDEINRQCGHHIRWRRWADALSAILAIRVDRSGAALDRLDDLLSNKGNQFPGQHCWYVLQLIRGHLERGRPNRAGLLMKFLLNEVREREEYWLLSEIIRLRGEIDAGPDADVRFLETLQLAKEQTDRISAARGARRAFGRWIHIAGARGTDSWSSPLIALPRSVDAEPEIF